MKLSAQNIQRRAESVAVSLPPLLVAAERVALSVLQGVHGRRSPGPGETFWQFRRYEPTDSVSSIDWRQSGKTQHVYVREQEWEASQTIWLWCDRTRSMDFRSDTNHETKEVRALILSLALAMLLLRSGEQVGVVNSIGKSFRGLGALPRLAEIMVRDTDLRNIDSLKQYTLRRDAQIIIISDFLEPLTATQEIIGWFSGQQLKGHLLQVLDPAEAALPFRGRAHFVGSEMEGEITINRVEAIQEQYLERFKSHQDDLSRMAGHAGWTLRSHGTSENPEIPLSSLYLVLSNALDRAAH